MKKFDLLLTNAKIYTLEKEGETFAAMGVRRGRITALFSDPPDSPSSQAKRVVDAAGRAVLPGLIDSHMHFMTTAALRELALSVSEIRDGGLWPANLAGVREKLTAFAAGRDPASPILAFNYIIASMAEDRLPTRHELDGWLPGRTVVIISMDGHSSAYSTPALRRMGLFREDGNGILTGEEHEFNMGKVNGLVEKSLTLGRLLSGVRHTVNDALGYGLTGLHCLEGFEDTKSDRTLWFMSRFGGVLPLHVRLFIQYRDRDRVRPFMKRLTYPRLGGCGSWEMDGSIGSGTAAFDESYAGDPGNFGRLYCTREQADAQVAAVSREGWQLSVHAIGTRAIETILSAFEKTGDHNDRRHRIDHFEFPSAGQVRRAVDHGLILTAQPGYAWMDETYQKAYRKYLRPEQFDRQIPLKTIAGLGGVLCGSSDSPVQDMNPFLQIHGMVNFPLEKERLSVYEALRAYTYNGAYATFEEAERGTLAVGKQADFIIMDRDPFTADPGRLAELHAAATYLGGKPARPMNSNLRLLLRGLLGPRKKI